MAKACLCLGQTGTGGEGGESFIHPYFDLVELVGDGDGNGNDRVLVCETREETAGAGGDDNDLKGLLVGLGVQSADLLKFRTATAFSNKSLSSSSEKGTGAIVFPVTFTLLNVAT